MSKRGLTLLLVFLLLILAAEGALIYLYPTAGGFPWSSSESANTTPLTNTETNTPPQNTTEQPTTTGNLASAVAVYKVTEKATGATYTETRQIISEKNTDGTKTITIVSTNDRSAGERGEARGILQADGSFIGQSLGASADGFGFMCTGTLPLYLAKGGSQPASLSCTLEGAAFGNASIPAVTFAGTATAGAESTFTFDGVTYKGVRTTTVSSNVGETGSFAHQLTNSFAPGLGTYKTTGSLTTLIPGLGQGQNNEIEYELISMDNPSLFLP